MTDAQPADRVPQATELRHRAKRRKVGMPGHALSHDGSTFAVTITDLSYDGCRIQSPVALLPGVAFTLSASGLGVAEVETRWFANGEAGVRFYNNLSAAAADLRTQERLTVRTEIRVKRRGGLSYETNLDDLSETGCKVSFVELPHIGDVIWVKLPSLEALEGRVRWIEGGIGGVEFVRTIHPAVLRLLTSKLR